MRHARHVRRLSRPSEHRQALLSNLASAVLQHGRIRTTVVKAKETQRVIDRLISLGKEGSIHSRRQAFRLLQDRGDVKRLFADIAPRFLDCAGGYTRVLKLSPRVGDGAPLALLELTRLPVEAPKAPQKAKPERAPREAPPESAAPTPKAAPQKPKRLFEGLRGLFHPKKQGRPES